MGAPWVSQVSGGDAFAAAAAAAAELACGCAFVLFLEMGRRKKKMAETSGAVFE